jgi:hypothetical protein
MVSGEVTHQPSAARDGDGSVVHPAGGVVPILKAGCDVSLHYELSISGLKAHRDDLRKACFTNIRFVAALVSRENERRPIAGRRTGLMHVSLLGWLSAFACALR